VLPLQRSHPELLKTLLEWDDVTDPRADQAFKDHVAASAAAWEAEKIPYAHASFGLRNRIVRMPLLKGTVSMTMDGKQGCAKLMGRIKNPDLGSMRILHLPHSWNHCMGDHIIVFTVWPISAQETMVTTKWLVHKDAVEGVDYDPSACARCGTPPTTRTVAWPKKPARHQLHRLPAGPVLQDL
jgi:Rieske 2Fe-2S family protein